MALKELATDLLVIGAGNAALVAAETAYDAGLKVTVLERAPKQRRGGNSAFSGGLFRFAFDDFERVKEIIKETAGIEFKDVEVEPYPNDMFYGEVTPAAPDDPFPGYMPPPLDGIFATGPYLHNGSVPTVELVLNSKARPKYWKRVDLDDTNFDEESLGFPWEEVTYPQAEALDAEKPFIYDTTYWSQGNGGHTFGDHLTTDERRSVIEYLKTL